jgi:hypothetical protein
VKQPSALLVRSGCLVGFGMVSDNKLSSVKAIVLASPAHMCWRVGHLVLFEEKENCSS